MIECNITLDSDLYLNIRNQRLNRVFVCKKNKTSIYNHKKCINFGIN